MTIAHRRAIDIGRARSRPGGPDRCDRRRRRSACADGSQHPIPTSSPLSPHFPTSSVNRWPITTSLDCRTPRMRRRSWAGPPRRPRDTPPLTASRRSGVHTRKGCSIEHGSRPHQCTAGRRQRRRRSHSPAPRAARRRRGGRARARHRLPHRRQPRGELAARRDRDRTGQSRLHERGPDRVSRASERDQPSHPAPSCSPRRRRTQLSTSTSTGVGRSSGCASTGACRTASAPPSSITWATPVRADRQPSGGGATGGSSQGRPRGRDHVADNPLPSCCPAVAS